MASVTLNKLWINLLSTGEGIAGASNRGKSYGAEVDLSVRTYANGRRRAIATAGIKREIPYTLVALDLATKIKLESCIGQSIQVRDNRGQKWFGTFAGVSTSEYMPTGLYAVSFTLLETTVVEGV